MRLLEIGDPAPWFSLPSTVNPLFHFSTVGGRRIVLFFFATASYEPIQTALKGFQDLQAEFEQLRVPLFGVSIDPVDRETNRPSQLASSFIFFWDIDKTVSQQYGVCQTLIQGADSGLQYAPHTFILNENLQVIATVPIGNPAEHAQKILRFLKALPPQEEGRPAPPHAPVLVIPRVFDPAFCRYLIDRYKADGGSPSGFMRQVAGKTVGLFDDNFKKRRDFFIEDPALQRRINTLILRRVKPEIEKAFQFTLTRFERYLIACYDADTGGYFRPHRDNTSSGTLHRRFAMTLNLNTGEYSGGYLRFPEFSPNGYRPEAGSAVIFSCSLLHEATPVSAGQRFAFLSFFYGEEDARVRQENLKYLDNKSPRHVSELAPTELVHE